MLSIRMRPVGKKHQRSYRIVVDERRHKLQGKNVEDLGWYNPHTKNFDLKNDRLLHWIQAGAQPSDSVHNLLVRARVIKGKKIPTHNSKPAEPEPAKATESAVPVSEAAPAPAAPVSADPVVDTEENKEEQPEATA
jgi:small subunit ribosomal protein S16